MAKAESNSKSESDKTDEMMEDSLWSRIKNRVDMLANNISCHSIKEDYAKCIGNNLITGPTYKTGETFIYDCE